MICFFSHLYEIMKKSLLLFSLDISGMYCHKCLDLEADKTSEIRVAPLELSVVRSLYNGAHPGSCHERNLQKCHDPDSVCAMSDVIFTGSCKN